MLRSHRHSTYLRCIPMRSNIADVASILRPMTLVALRRVLGLFAVLFADQWDQCQLMTVCENTTIE